MHFLGIDIGGTNLKSGIINEQGELVSATTQPANARLGLNSLLHDIIVLIEKNISEMPDICAIGIGVPGIVRPDGVITIAPNLTGWVNVPLIQILKGKFKMPMVADNDANTAAIAELELGAGRNARNFIYVTLGTGVGGAIIINREVFHGDSGGAGEIGHIIIDAYAPLNVEKPYRTGILEEKTGRCQITDRAKEILKKYPDSALNAYPRPDPYFISQTAAAGDEAALTVLRDVGRTLGLGLSTLATIFDIKLFVFGGGISCAHPLMLETALNTIKERALPSIADGIRLVQAEFNKDAGIIGAALFGKKTFFSDMN